MDPCCNKPSYSRSQQIKGLTGTFGPLVMALPEPSNVKHTWRLVSSFGQLGEAGKSRLAAKARPCARTTLAGIRSDPKTIYPAARASSGTLHCGTRRATWRARPGPWRAVQVALRRHVVLSYNWAQKPTFNWGHLHNCEAG